jgi:molybdopterin-guanine dinucleotide biosynthesis protein A
MTRRNVAKIKSAKIKSAGVVLCGGKSSRMGLDKASLPFGDETMLARVTRLLATVVDRIVVVAAPDQPALDLSVPATYVHDRTEGRGPLEGLAVGIGAVADEVDVVFATSCDVPLLVPGLVEHLLKLLGGHQIVVPQDEKYFHPLAAVYRVSVLPEIEKLLRENRRRPFFLFEAVDTLAVPTATLRSVDPTLSTLLNLNSPEDYLNALQLAGLEPSQRILAELLGDGPR